MDERKTGNIQPEHQHHYQRATVARKGKERKIVVIDIITSASDRGDRVLFTGRSSEPPDPTVTPVITTLLLTKRHYRKKEKKKTHGDQKLKREINKKDNRCFLLCACLLARQALIKSAIDSL